MLQKTFSLYTSGFGVLTKLAAMDTVLVWLIWAPLLTILKPAFEIESDKLSNPEYLVAHFRGFYAMLYAYILVSLVVGALMTGPICRAIVDLYMGRQPNLKTCLKVGVMRAHTIFCASVVASICVGLATLCFIVPGVYLSVRWFFVSPIIVVEGLGVFASLKRSSALTMGSGCYVFCTYMFCSILLYILNLVWQHLTIGAGSNDAIFTIFGSLLGLVPSIVFVPVLSIVMTLMYLNMRIEKEGLNEETLIRNMGDSGALDAGYAPLADQGAENEELV